METSLEERINCKKTVRAEIMLTEKYLGYFYNR